MISEKDCVVSEDGRLYEIFNERFINVTKNFDLKTGIILTIQVFPKLMKRLMIILVLIFFPFRKKKCQFKFN